MLTNHEPSSASTARTLASAIATATQVGAQGTNLLRRGVLPQKEYDRVTYVLKQQERDESHRGHDDHGLKQAAQDKGEHGL